MPRLRRFDDHPIERLKKHGTVTVEQGAACDEMIDVFMAMLRVGNIQCAGLLSDVHSRVVPMERAAVAKYTRLFESVLATMGDDARLVFDMVEGAMTFTAVARKHGVRLTTAKAKLLKALDLWIELKATACF